VDGIRYLVGNLDGFRGQFRLYIINSAGFAADLALYYVPDRSGITGLNWRLMLGSAGIPAIILCTNIFFCPE
jgi:hypothetical protein